MTIEFTKGSGRMRHWDARGGEIRDEAGDAVLFRLSNRMQLLVNPVFKEDLDERLVWHVPLIGDGAELFQHVFGQAQ